MDIYGIGLAARGAVLVFLRSMRGSGRTSDLLDIVREDDLIVFADKNEAESVQNAYRVDHPDVLLHYIVVEPTQEKLIELYERARSRAASRLLFDHGWLEQYYVNVLDKARQNLESLSGDVTRGHAGPVPETVSSMKNDRKWGDI